MVVRSGGERAKAFRFRSMIERREPLSAEQRAWLTAYKAGGPLPQPAPVAPRAPRGVEQLDEDPIEQPRRRAPRAGAVDEPPRSQWAPIGGAHDDDDDDDDEHQGGEGDKPTCTIKDCPACAGRMDGGPQICVATGKKVWPAISTSGARMLAGVILFVIGFAVRVAYRQPEIVDPTELELEELASSIVEVVRRRAGWVQAVDDLLGAAWTMGAYTKRARKVKELPAPKEK